MPEGDTLWRTAARLHPALAARTVTRFWAHSATLAAAARRHRLEGSTLTAVETRGKHLLVRFSTREALHTHMGMTGSWHLYRKGTRWRLPEHLARVVIEAGDVLAVCFVPRVAELVREAEEPAHGALRALGPDVVSTDFDAEAAVRRLRARGEMEIGAALLDQAALSGIGNIYKSEALFAGRVNPFQRVRDVPEPALRRVVDVAHRMMRRSVAAPVRVTAPGSGGYWVYGRAGRPCRRCGTFIRTARQGRPSRSTYWCTGCQRAPSRH